MTYKELTFQYLRDNFKIFDDLTNSDLTKWWVKYSNRYGSTWISIDHKTANKFHKWYVEKNS